MIRGKGSVAIVAVLALAVLAALVLGIAACGGSSATGSNSTPVKGGTLTVTFQGEPTGLDPAIAWEIESWSIERLTYQTFLTYASKPSDAGTQLVPELATEVPTVANGGITANGTVYTFHIRHGVRFAPPVNRVVTAADFKWSFERMMKQPLAPATYFYTGIVGAQDFLDGKARHISGFTVVNPYTVQITLVKPDGVFLMEMSLPFTSVLPKEWVLKVGNNIKREPLGTGPYKIVNWTRGQSITAVRNTNWTGKGQQWVNTMKFNFSANPSSALLELERGQSDVMGDPIPAAAYVQTTQDPRWGKNVVSAPQIGWYYIFMNVLEKPFDSMKVRQAVNYAIDTQRIQKLLGGQGRALNQLYPQYMPGHEAGAQFYTYDPAKAKALLAAAGYPHGFQTTFYTHNAAPFPELAQAIQADLKAVGIQATIKQMDSATYWNFIALKKSHVGIGLNDWYQDFPDPSDWIGPLFTQPTDGGENSSFYDNPRVDVLYNAASSELNAAKRLQMFQEMQYLIMNDAPTAPLYQPQWNAIHGATTGGFYLHPVWTFEFQDYWKTNGK